MNKTDIETLYCYNEWAWRRVLGQAALVSSEQYTTPDFVGNWGLHTRET